MAPRSTDSRSVDSPVPLVGRDAEIGQAWRLIRDRPGLLVVTGARGTGRTRLAQEIAELERRNGTPLVHAGGRAGGPDGIDEYLETKYVALAH